MRCEYRFHPPGSIDAAVIIETDSVLPGIMKGHHLTMVHEMLPLQTGHNFEIVSVETLVSVPGGGKLARVVIDVYTKERDRAEMTI